MQRDPLYAYTLLTGERYPLKDDPAYADLMARLLSVPKVDGNE